MNPPKSNFLATSQDSTKFLLTSVLKHSIIIAIMIIITQKIPAKNENVKALNVFDNAPILWNLIILTFILNILFLFFISKQIKLTFNTHT